jgi:Chaperone of endosialidase
MTTMKTVITSNSSLLTILRSRSALILIALALAAFAFVQSGQAVNPPPDGGYAGGNTAEGQGALLNLTSGTFNTAIGFLSLSGLKEGNFNTGLGAGTLLFNVADENTATGAGALLSNTTGNLNTANGAFALFLNTEGAFNTATGDRVLFSNTSGSANSAFGSGALASNTVGFNNTANGMAALSHNTTGRDNTANGVQALNSNTTGGGNTANGDIALFNNTTGGDNTADGTGALQNNTTGGANTALGAGAGLGVFTASHVIAIGTNGADVSDSCFIGNIRGVRTANADAISVVIDSAGQLGTLSSSRRFKKEIKPMDSASKSILALKPVTFHYKSDKTGMPQFGLIAEEVADVNPDLVVRDDQGEIYTVRYEAVNAMLLNEFLKEHKKVEAQHSKIEKQEAAITELKSNLAEQHKQIQTLIAGLQKVSAQVGVSVSRSKVVANEQPTRKSTNLKYGSSD